MNPFQKSMQPWPGLAHWSHRVRLPRNQIELHVYDTGETEKPPVLLLHGLGDEADTWRHLFPPLSSRFRLVAPDLPGFGRSEKPDRRYTIPFYMDVALELLEVLGIQRVALVGHSMGAIVAQAIALENPEQVRSLVLIGGTLVSQAQKLNLGTLLFLVPGLGEWLYNRLRKDPQAAYRTLEPYCHRLEDLPQADRDFLFQRVNERVWSDAQRRGFLSALRGLAAWIPAQQKGLPARLKLCSVPTLVIWGEQDRINAPESGRLLAGLQPAARLVIVPGAGHNVHQEKPEEVVDLILPALVE
jgi:pimeloyl-ACP methyl ester carboxylesterase